ncbi:MAG: amidohydrolase family protein [Gemmatimonadales bacterium]
MFRRAVRMGVPLAYGTDSGVYPHGDNALQLPYMVRYGMTPMRAVQSATIDAARLMGWEDRVGSIAPGKLADLVAVDGHDWDRLERLAAVRFVMQGGRVIRDSGR